jgi:hypothetical protein
MPENDRVERDFGHSQCHKEMNSIIVYELFPPHWNCVQSMIYAAPFPLESLKYFRLFL